MNTPPDFRWVDSTEETYYDALEVLPPAAMRPGMFLLGEPQSHTAEGLATFDVHASAREGECIRYVVGSRAITRAEFRELVTPCETAARFERACMGSASELPAGDPRP